MPILALLFFLAPQTQDAPELALHLQGDFRWRMEWRDLSGKRSHPASWRSRLSARGTPMPSLQVAAEWLTSIPTAGVPAKGSMSQAWAELEGFASSGARLRVGRFPLKAGEGRLLGRDDWSLFPRAFDGWAWSGGSSGKDWTLFSTSVAPFPGRSSGEDILEGALGRWEDVAPHTSLEGWLLRSGNEEDVRITTAGIGLKNEFSPRLHASLESNAQGGEDQGVSLKGSAAMGRMEWQLAPGHTLHLEHAFSSGDASGSGGRFRIIQPDSHVHHGFMDRFGASNIKDTSIGWTGFSGRVWTWGFAHHRFRAHDSGQGAVSPSGGISPAGNGDFGREWDFHLRGSLDHGVAVDLGAAWLETGSGLPGEDGGLWFFTQFSLSF